MWWMGWICAPRERALKKNMKDFNQELNEDRHEELQDRNEDRARAGGQNFGRIWKIGQKYTIVQATRRLLPFGHNVCRLVKLLSSSHPILSRQQSISTLVLIYWMITIAGWQGNEEPHFTLTLPHDAFRIQNHPSFLLLVPLLTLWNLWHDFLIFPLLQDWISPNEHHSIRHVLDGPLPGSNEMTLPNQSSWMIWRTNWK